MFNMNIYMKTNFLKNIGKSLNLRETAGINVNKFSLVGSKCFSSVMKKKGKGNWDFVFVLPEKTKNNLAEYRFKEIELDRLADYADSTIKFLKKINKEMEEGKKKQEI